MVFVTKTSDQTRQRGHTLSRVVMFVRDECRVEIQGSMSCPLSPSLTQKGVYACGISIVCIVRSFRRANRSELLKLERRLADLVADRRGTSTQLKPMPAVRLSASRNTTLFPGVACDCVCFMQVRACFSRVPSIAPVRGSPETCRQNLMVFFSSRQVLALYRTFVRCLDAKS